MNRLLGNLVEWLWLIAWLKTTLRACLMSIISCLVWLNFCKGEMTFIKVCKRYWQNMIHFSFSFLCFCSLESAYRLFWCVYVSCINRRMSNKSDSVLLDVIDIYSANIPNDKNLIVFIELKSKNVTEIYTHLLLSFTYNLLLTKNYFVISTSSIC